MKDRIAVKINGRELGFLYAEPDASTQEVMEIAKISPSVQHHIAGRMIIKEVYVPRKMLNIVVK